MFVVQLVGVLSCDHVNVTVGEVEVFGRRCPLRSGESSSIVGVADALSRPDGIAIDVDFGPRAS